MLSGILAVSPVFAAPPDTGADLQLLVLGASHFLPEGATASATVLVSNRGPGPVTSPLTVSVSLGGGLEFVAASGLGATCTSGQDFECTMTLPEPPFAEPYRLVAMLFIDVYRAAPGTITATVTNGDDPRLDNNTAVYDVLVDQPPPLCDGCPPPIGMPMDIPLPETGTAAITMSIAALTAVLLGVGLAVISRRRRTP
jgi:LPXTG-motif cell wall-anchored protein